ncbi:nicotinate-nicotinamide nucleotide adenylyltransferase [Psychrobacter alimentarius]|uniref:nicotinate-nicotinamide nucleotide adenylyltransferase n=1 Tax=Psychrobacter TaxID=497 RepID=UPI000BAA9C82|nr:nicotinate-nicotinamide nucleotide adenylyltransferase [Psychrobacter sp. JB193]PAT64628.1 nicotinate-nicotinamide nucleotide adenylyltransferase [Psychrobacter sp. JB193]
MPNTTDSLDDKTSRPAIRAYLGGSFDPVHQGHIQMAMYVYERLLPIAEGQQRDLHVSLLPNSRSPFKQKSTDPHHRLAMLKLATQKTPIQIDELELWQTPPVYTIDSVRTLRQRYPRDSLIFIIGMDSALSLPHWKEGLALTNHVNLWIFSRSHVSRIFDKDGADKDDVDNDILPDPDNMPNTDTIQAKLPVPLQSLVVGTPTELVTPITKALATNTGLKSTHQGHIYIDSRPVAAVSSTQMREQLQSLQDRLNIMQAADRQMTSIPPINDIMSHTATNPLPKWLNPAVYHYIIAHQLYSAAQFR